MGLVPYIPQALPTNFQKNETKRILQIKQIAEAGKE